MTLTILLYHWMPQVQEQQKLQCSTIVQLH